MRIIALYHFMLCFEYEYNPYELSRVLDDIQSQIMINNVLLHNWYSFYSVLNLYNYIYLSGLKLHNIMLNIRQHALRACWLCFLIVVSVVLSHGHDETKKKKHQSLGVISVRSFCPCPITPGWARRCGIHYSSLSLTMNSASETMEDVKKMIHTLNPD